jgi:hypothetical protein
MLTNILPDLQKIPRCFMQQHGSSFQKNVSMTGSSGQQSMGVVPIFRILGATLQLDGLHLQLVMSSRLTTSSFSQSPHHLISFKKFLGQ